MTGPRDWIAVLRARCAETSQAAVARRIGYSAAVISLVLKGDYRGSLTAVEAAFRDAFMPDTITCPVLGDILRPECAEHQARPFGGANPTHTDLYRACRGGCPHSTLTNRSKP